MRLFMITPNQFFYTWYRPLLCNRRCRPCVIYSRERVKFINIFFSFAHLASVLPVLMIDCCVYWKSVRKLCVTKLHYSTERCDDTILRHYTGQITQVPTDVLSGSYRPKMFYEYADEHVDRNYNMSLTRSVVNSFCTITRRWMVKILYQSMAAHLSIFPHPHLSI